MAASTASTKSTTSTRVAERAQAHVTHQAPGRVRLRFPAQRRDEAFFHETAASLREIDGVDGVEVNPRLGSMLIRHSRSWPELAAAAEAAGLFAVRTPVPAAIPEVDDRARACGFAADTFLRRQTGGALGLGGSAVLGLFILGLVQLARGNITVPAITFFWYAASIVLLERVGRRDDG